MTCTITTTVETSYPLLGLPTFFSTRPRLEALDSPDYRGQFYAFSWNRRTDPHDKDSNNAEHVQNCSAGAGAEDKDGEKSKTTARYSSEPLTRAPI